MKKDLESIKKETADLKTKFDKEAIVDEIKVKVLEDLREEEEKKSKENNLIIFGLKESEKEIGKEREQDDFELSKELLVEGVNIAETEFVIEKACRIGARKKTNVGEAQGTPVRNPKPRPLVIKLESKSQKWKVMGSVKKLRDSENRFNGISIAPDLTKKEREHLEAVREEKKRREDNGDYSWTIYKGELVKKRNFRPGGVDPRPN